MTRTIIVFLGGCFELVALAAFGTALIMWAEWWLG